MENKEFNNIYNKPMVGTTTPQPTKYKFYTVLSLNFSAINFMQLENHVDEFANIIERVIHENFSDSFDNISIDMEKDFFDYRFNFYIRIYTYDSVAYEIVRNNESYFVDRLNEKFSDELKILSTEVKANQE